MKIPHDISALAGVPGPFATVYLDVTRSVEQAQQEIALRWRALRAELGSAGAPETALAAIDGVVGRHDLPGERGQVVVANADGVLFDRLLPHRPRRDEARWAPLPHLVPYLAGLHPATAHVIVRADHTGADLALVAALDAAEGAPAAATTHVTGSEQHPITKTSVRDWSERHFQQRVENAWAANARDVAEAVGKQVAAGHARVVVLTGDPRARSLLKQDLPHVLHPDVAVLDADDAADGGVPGVLLRHAWRERREVLEHLQQNLGRGEYAVAGVEPVLHAVRRAQVDTLVLSDDPSSTLTAWVGPEPLQLGRTAEEIAAMGVADPRKDRFDAALLRALAGSGADIVITPNAHEYVADGIAALLRYTDAVTGS